MDIEYIRLVKDILDQGTTTIDRTGTGTKQLFGVQLKFDLSTNLSTASYLECKIPLLTTKRMAVRTLIKEILWMLSGSTDSLVLEREGINIWKHNTSRQALDKLGLNHYPVGEIGPTYGHNFRHYGATYSSTGLDQLKALIDEIKTNPNSRRLIINLWDPITINECALPPCVYCYQFCISEDKLHLLVSQRSADVALGLPFNIAQSTIILGIVAQATGYEVGTLTYSIGCAHIYSNHIDSISDQIKLEPLDVPTVRIKYCDFLDDPPSHFKDIEIVGYRSHPPISYALS